MNARTRFKSTAFEAIHSAASGLRSVGVIDEPKMHLFNASCVVAAPYISPAQLKKIRTDQKLSPKEFAAHLNSSTLTVTRWEAGTQRPNGTALKLLSVIQKHGLNVLR